MYVLTYYRLREFSKCLYCLRHSVLAVVFVAFYRILLKQKCPFIYSICWRNSGLQGSRNEDTVVVVNSCKAKTSMS
jgi:hypothetical protein